MTSTLHLRVQLYLNPQQINMRGFCWKNMAASFRTLLPSRSTQWDFRRSSIFHIKWPWLLCNSIFWFFNRQVSAQVSLPLDSSNFWQVKPLISTKDSFETEGNPDRWGCETDYLGAAESNITVYLTVIFVIMPALTKQACEGENEMTDSERGRKVQSHGRVHKWCIPHIYVTCSLVASSFLNMIMALSL